MRTRQKFLSILLTLCMVFVMVPITVFAAERYGINVNNVPITDANASDVLGDGTVFYDAETNTLTLEDAEISGDFSGSAAIYATKADLTIMLEGNNKITSGNFGIIHTTGTLTFRGEGVLTVNSDGDAVRAAEIIVDGTTLNMQTTDGCGLYATVDNDSGKGSVSILNGASVTGDCKGFVVYADGTKGISISESTVTADVEYDGTVIYTWNGPLSIINSNVTVENSAQTIHPSIWATEISISDNSEVTATVSGETNAVFTPAILTVENSSLTAESPYISVWSNEDMEIDNGTVKTTCTGDYDYVTDSLHSEGTLTIEGNSDVLAIGGIWGTKGVIVSPAEGNKVDVKVGIKENGEEGTKHLEGSPYGEITTLDSYDVIGGYTYVHIKNHTHVYNREITDEKYLKSAADCETPAIYYKSCICGAFSETEGTFTNGEATGHDWGEPEWSWSNDGQSVEVSFTCKNDSSHVEKPTVSIDSTEKTPATCTEAGTTTYTAKVTFNGQGYASFKDVDDIDPLGHKVKKVDGNAPTATKPGNIEYWYCSVCDTYFKDEALTIEITKEQTILAPTGEEKPEPSEPEENPPAPTDPPQENQDKTDETTGSPQTGDSSNLALWFSLMGVGAAGLGGVLLLQKRRRSKAE